jgi:hypothetical protein
MVIRQAADSTDPRAGASPRRRARERFGAGLAVPDFRLFDRCIARTRIVLPGVYGNSIRSSGTRVVAIRYEPDP